MYICIFIKSVWGGVFIPFGMRKVPVSLQDYARTRPIFTKIVILFLHIQPHNFATYKTSTVFTSIAKFITDTKNMTWPTVTHHPNKNKMKLRN